MVGISFDLEGTVSEAHAGQRHTLGIILHDALG